MSLIRRIPPIPTLSSPLYLASDRSRVDFIQFLSIFLLCCSIASTIQTQDFPDVVGDLKMGRYTLVIAHPKFSRFTPLMTLTPWSLYLCSIWEISFPVTIAYLLLGTSVGLRFYLRRTPAEDRLSYFMYNVSALDLISNGNTKLNSWFRFGLLSPS